jgi:hypothetical protein
VTADFTMREQESKKKTLIEGPWFQNPKNCLRHFQNMIREGCDVTDCWGTRHYLVMRLTVIEQHPTP